jgi:hypothetical protein
VSRAFGGECTEECERSSWLEDSGNLREAFVVLEPMRCLSGGHHVHAVAFYEREVLGGGDFVFDGWFPIFRLGWVYGGEHFFRGICSNDFVELLAQLLRDDALQGISEVHDQKPTGPHPRSTAVPNGSL